jgi:hypothetical protein
VWIDILMRIYMLSLMRTTLEIDDSVFREAKQRAAERGRTLGQLVSDALREILRDREKKDSVPFVMPVFGAPGQIVSRDPETLAALRDDGR